MRKSKSPMGKLKKIEKEIKIDKNEIEIRIKKFNEMAKILEKSNLEKMKLIKNNQKDLKKLLNESKEENRTFLARLKTAVDKKNPKLAVFTLKDPFIKKNLEKITDILNEKGIQLEKTPEKNISNRSIGSNSSFYKNNKGSKRWSKSKTKFESIENDTQELKDLNITGKSTQLIDNFNNKDLLIFNKFEKNQFRKFSSNLRAFHYSKLLNS